MRVKDVSISKGMTVNLGNRNFTKVEIGMSATVDDGDDYDQNLEKITEFVNKKLAQEVEKVLPKRQTLMETKKMETKKKHGREE